MKTYDHRVLLCYRIFNFDREMKAHHYKLNSSLNHPKVNWDDLKKELSKNHVVLLPVNARLLGNPTYQESGPFYHMIVVRGYDTSGFIINDPGTTQGNGIFYSFETLKKASADWNNFAKIMDSTIKIALILSR